jgi:methylase of polypeptide subunit release factors
MADFDWPKASKYISIDGGHPPSRFAEAFAETIPIEPGRTRFLDIGCGSGIIGIYCLIETKAAFVTFNDILDEWISIARVNVNKKIEQGEILRSQAEFINAKFTDIPGDVIARHSLLGFNPPQLPDKYLGDVGEDRVRASFRNGGPDGLEVARQFFEWYAGLDVSKPDAVILLSSFLGWSRITEAIERHRIQWRELKRTRVTLREFMWNDAKKLSSDRKEKIDRSLVEGPGDSWTKELVTILLTRS